MDRRASLAPADISRAREQSQAVRSRPFSRRLLRLTGIRLAGKCSIAFGMNDFASAFQIAVALIARFDLALREIVLLSLQVSLTASACAFLIGAPLGTALAVYRFRGRGAVVVLANTLLGLPPVVVGLVVYLLLSRSGP